MIAQPTPEGSRSSETREFPVIMQQNVAAGATPVGPKVHAKLLVATLVDGEVVPRNAVLSGEVTESVAKSATEPSRLAIRMDLAQWKHGSAPLRLYLTAWYYPTATMMSQDLSYQPPDAALSPRNWNGEGPYPVPNSPATQPFPGPDTDRGGNPAPPASPSSSISKHRVLMKDVESKRDPDGTVSLTCTRFNIKIDKLTTYVLAAGDLLTN
jgi:hypothetical protein